MDRSIYISRVLNRLTSFAGKNCFFLSVLLLASFSGRAQLRPLVSCILSGTSPVDQLSTYTYSLSGSCSNNAANWSVDCETITSSDNNSVTVFFNNVTCSSVVITAYNSDGDVLVTKTVSVNVPPPLNGGTILNPSQATINWNTAPNTINASGENGGTCSGYTYQWWSSTDNVNWNAINNSNVADYPSGLLTVTTYFKRLVDCGSQAVYTSNVATVNVYPRIVPGTISPSSQPTINYGTYALPLSISNSGGGNGTYTCQWQSLPAGATVWGDVGSPGTGYTPGPLTGNTQFRVAVFSNGAVEYSNPVTVNVYPQLRAAITPASQSIDYNTVPPPLSVAPQGGDLTYGYQWYSDATGSFQPIAGAMINSYTPGALKVTTHYYVVVTSNGASVTSATATITVGAPLSDADLNYIRTRTIKKPGVADKLTADGLSDNNDVQQSTTYFDGLSRPIQSVAKHASPLGNDMVVPQVYDPFGREALHYLPYVSSSSDGSYKPDALGDQSAFNTLQFPGEQYYYGRTDFEPSPLNRPVANYPAGNSWVGSSRGVTAQYLVNTVSDSVQIWNIGIAIGSLPVNAGSYPAGRLYMSTTTDEQQQTVIEYKDKDGQVVLKKIRSWNTPAAGHSGWLSTYYVYDDLNNLRFVIPPKAVEWLMTNSWNFGTTTGGQVAYNLCFRYEYDARNRMIIKRVPGAGPHQMVYDIRDRLVMTQDSNALHDGYWIVTKYDNLNRPDSTGMLVDANTRIYHQNLASASSTYPAISGTGYTSYIRTFYDDYSWIPGTTSLLNSTFSTKYIGNSNYFITSLNSGPVYAQALTPTTMTRGSVTGTAMDVIGSAYNLFRVNFYDDRGRLLQTVASNFQSGRDTTTWQYDFTGKVLRKLLTQCDLAAQVKLYTVSTKSNYDPMGRPTSTLMRLDNATSDQLIDSLTYDELGWLKVRNLGNNLDNLVYDYNIRGWMNGINRNYIKGLSTNYFGMELGYDNAATVATGTTFGNLQYNGNIAGAVWKSAGDGVNRKYDYKYDNVNRLIDAGFSQSASGSAWGNTAMDFSVHNLSYDANGNILTMSQHGFKIGNPGSAIDSLTYGYLTNSNQLNQVVDAVNDTASILGDFHYKGSKTGQDYHYDGNGTVFSDKNKGLALITHNALNLPQSYFVPGRGNVQITYSADGEKLRKIVWDSVTRHLVTTTYSEGGLVYSRTDSFVASGVTQDTLQFVPHGEGRARWALHHYLNGTTGYGWEYDFMERDHLGNTRVLLTQEKDTAGYLASMEGKYRAKEDQLFYNIPTTAYARSSVMGYPVDTTVTSPNDSVARVNGNGPKTGPAIILKVMSGDKVDIGVNYYYNNVGTTNGQSLSASDIINSLAMGVVSLSGATHGSFSDLTGGASPLPTALNSFITANNPNATGKPNAYLNWILLDNQFNYVSSFPQSGALQVGAYGTQSGGILQSPLAQTGIPITKSGYLYIYVSNATPGWDVFFDNLCVKQYSGPMLEEDHYYPFGLTMAGISDKAIKSNYAENKYRFNNGTELANKEFADGSGLETYETPFRGYDPQLGRFHQVDPLADITESYSPYTFALNNPISYNDAWGLVADSAGKPKTDPAADVKPMPAVIVSAGKKDCVTCDAVAKDFGPAPTSAPAPIKSGSAAAFTITVGALGNAAEGGITITGGATSLPILWFAGSLYGMYEVTRMHLPSPVINVPRSDTRSFAPAIALPGYVGGKPAEHSYTYATEPWGEQYTLRAATDGLYPVYDWGQGIVANKHLSRGDIWKIGTTMVGQSARGYSNNFLNNTGAGLNYVVEFVGPQEQILFVEKMKLLNYIIQYQAFPPGNTKLQ